MRRAGLPAPRAGNAGCCKRCAPHGRGYLRQVVQGGCRAVAAFAGTEVAVSVVAKVKDKAAGVYEQAKAKYADANARQRAGQQASQMTSRIRDLSGKASSSPLAGKLRDASGKATAAVKDARARRHPHQ